jgi:hypothetical protein
MKRRFKLLILFLCAIASTTALFGANAARVGNNRAHMVPIGSRNQSLSESGPETSSVISGKSNTSQTALGFYQSPGIEVGTTSCDLQHYMRMARQVEVGADGRVHFVWTATPLPYDQAARNVQYDWYLNGILGEAFNLSASTEPAKTPGRFCTVDVAVSPEGAQNRALVVNHYGSGPATTSALDIGSGSGSFTAVDPPSTVVNREGILTGGATTLLYNYVWPVVAADKDGTGKLVIHIAAMEGNAASGSWKAITYFRGVSTGVTMNPGMYGTAGMFFDSCQAIGYDIAASPYNNDVVIAYAKAREANSENNDLAYRLSTNMGETWGPVVNITNYATGALERCTGDLSVLFTSDGYFHILFVANIYDSVAGTVSDQQCKLKHWSSMFPSNTSLVLDANNEDDNCYTPAFEYNVSKVNLTQCHSTSLGRDLLYAVYSRQLGTTAVPDCSDIGYFNQEVFISPSSTWGETWGAPVNLTNTPTNDCVAGACADDGSSSSARYVADSLRIEYMEDLDAGSNVGNERGTASLLNPIMLIGYPCIDMTPYRIMTCTPSAIKYPFHAVRNATKTQELVLVNGGNQSINWNASLLGGGAPVSLVPGSGSVPAGYTNSATVTATVGPKSSEGLFHNTIRFTYDSGTKTFDIPIDFYVFDSWFLPQDVAIRTASNRMMVNQAGQAADNVSGSSFSYFASGGEDFIKDASLIIGNSADNLSWLIYNKGQGNPMVENNFGRLYALSNNAYDTTTFTRYRVAYGKGTNRDSTVGFDVRWYAAKFVDSADFYVGHFEVYKGVKNPTGTVTGLDIAFACDWDAPSDTSSDNSIGTDPSRQMIYLQGQYNAERQQGFAALAAYREDGQNLVPIVGGFAWGNNQQVYPFRGYQVDSVWKYVEATTSYNSLWSEGDSIGDMSIVMVIAKNYTVTPTSRLKFDVILAAKRAATNPSGLAGLSLAVDQAKVFLLNYSRCSTCGDANSDGAIDVSDIVFIIAYIFSGGTAPGWCNYANGKGDANGDGRISVADAVYLICRIFSGGPPPHCAGGGYEPGQDVGARDTIAIMCPTIVPSDHLVAGDSFRVEVYLFNDENIDDFSAGFSYTSDLIEITSVDFSGSIIPDSGYHKWRSDPASNRCLIGYVDTTGSYNGYIPARTQRGLLCALNFRMLPSIRADDVDIDSAFVPPAGYMELVSGVCGSNTFVPVYADCGVSDIRLGGGLGNLTLTFNPAFDVCPAGDAPFRVTIKDALGNPVVGDTAVRITLENCSGVRTCSSPSLPSTLHPIAPSDANGQVTFYTSGVNCGSSCQAVIRRKTDVYGTIPVRSFDTNGDSVVSIAGDWSTTSMCNDFNGNNTIDFNDQNLFTQHLGHRCTITPDPCDLFGCHFLLNPNINLDSGTVVKISLSIANNNQSQDRAVCSVNMINFYESPFGTGGTETYLYSMPYYHVFQSGEQDTTPTFQYTIPNWGARCLKAKFTPSCCGSQIEAQECFDARRPCRPDASYCYHFHISLNTSIRRCWRMQYLDTAAGWRLTDLRPGGFPDSGTSGRDSIDYLICTPDSPQLGDTGSVTTYVEDYSSRVWSFVNQVVVTSNTGDANGDCFVDISDAVYLIAYIFSGGSAPIPYRAGDVNCDDIVDISDVVYLIAYIFSGGYPPCLVTADFLMPGFGQ